MRVCVPISSSSSIRVCTFNTLSFVPISASLVHEPPAVDESGREEAGIAKPRANIGWSLY